MKGKIQIKEEMNVTIAFSEEERSKVDLLIKIYKSKGFKVISDNFHENTNFIYLTRSNFVK